MDTPKPLQPWMQPPVPQPVPQTAPAVVQPAPAIAPAVAQPVAQPAPVPQPVPQPSALVAPAHPDTEAKPDGTHPGHTERKHAKVSSSVMHRLWHCLYSVQDGLELPPETYSEAAERGTRYHEVIEIRLRDFLHHKEHGTSVDRHLDTIKSNPEYAEDLENMLSVADKAIESIWKECFNGTITNKYWDTESRFTLMENPAVNGIPDFWAAYINDKGQKEGYIWDYKNGVLDVAIKGNKQLLFLAACMQNEYGKKRPFDVIRVAIYQPNSLAGGPAYKEEKYTQKQIEAGKAKILKIAQKVYNPEIGKDGKPKGFKPKDGPGCKFCPALAICPEKKKQLRAITVMSPETDEIEIPSVVGLSDEVLRNVLEHEDQIKDFLKAVRDVATARAYTNTPLLGFKLVKGTSRRQWKKSDIATIVGELEALGATDVWGPKLNTLSSIEEQIGAAALEPFVQRTVAKELLVPEDDKREEVKPNEKIREVAGVVAQPAIAQPAIALPVPPVAPVVPEAPKAEVEAPVKRRRGRPKGSTSKGKTKTKAKAKAKRKTKKRTTRKTKG